MGDDESEVFCMNFLFQSQADARAVTAGPCVEA